MRKQVIVLGILMVVLYCCDDGRKDQNTTLEYVVRRQVPAAFEAAFDDQEGSGATRQSLTATADARTSPQLTQICASTLYPQALHPAVMGSQASEMAEGDTDSPESGRTDEKVVLLTGRGTRSPSLCKETNPCPLAFA